jgi:molybdopterin-guanine dinucleotide biosynthesis protein
MMLLGLRGTGKTVLLNEIGRIAEEQGYFISKIEAPEHQLSRDFFIQKCVRFCAHYHQ